MSQDMMSNMEAVVAQGPFGASWQSLAAYEIPQWYQDAKFGIFIHWGACAVPAFGNEWYPRNRYVEDAPEFAHHVETYGPQTEFGDKDFVPLFIEGFWSNAKNGLYPCCLRIVVCPKSSFLCIGPKLLSASTTASKTFNPLPHKALRQTDMAKPQ